MNYRLFVALLLANLWLLSAGPAAAAPGDCVLTECKPEIEEGPTLTISPLVAVFQQQGAAEGAVNVLDCAGDEVELAFEAVIAKPGAASVFNYSGGECLPEGSVLPGGGTFTTDVIASALTLPTVAVHVNPHAEFMVANFPAWFWHEGATTHTQDAVSVSVGGVTIVGDFEATATQFCWTVDDDAKAVAAQRVVELKQPCGAGSYGTTLTSTQPGVDDEKEHAATYTWTSRGFDSTIRHEVVWSGRFTVTAAPRDLAVGTVLDLAPILTSARATFPVKQIVPEFIPNPEP